jgi:hypothetical protein
MEIFLPGSLVLSFAVVGVSKKLTNKILEEKWLKFTNND